MDVLKLKRGEVIEQLRPFVSNRNYHKILDLPTPNLMAILTFYLAGGEEKNPVETPKQKEVVVVMIEAPMRNMVDISNRKREMFMDRLVLNVLTREDGPRVPRG